MKNSIHHLTTEAWLPASGPPQRFLCGVVVPVGPLRWMTTEAYLDALASDKAVGTTYFQDIYPVCPECLANPLWTLTVFGSTEL